MTVSTVRGGQDTWVLENKPGARRRGDPRLRISTGGSTDAIALLHKTNPVPRNATVFSATLRLVQDGAWTGSHTISVQRVTEAWKVGRVTWDTRPSSTATGQVQVTKSDSAHGTIWEFDVTAHIQAAVNGTAWRGWAILNSTSTRRRFFSLNADRNKPVLVVEWAAAPARPTTLSPSGGKVITASHPTVSCDFTDRTGSSNIGAIQVQIDAADDFASPDFDSGTVNVTDPELDLSTTAYVGLSAGATTYWRVRVQNEAGLWSPWSASTSFTRQAKGSLAITNPAASPNNFVSEHTPPFTWSHTVTTQTGWRLWLALASKPDTRLHDTGRRLGTASSYTPPGGIIKDQRDYIVTVSTWDQYEREATPDDPLVPLRASRTFSVAYEVLVTAPSSVTATQVGTTPAVELTWTRGTAPDSWTVERDGETIEVDLLPEDTLVSGTSHAWVDNTAGLDVEHSYIVRAIVNGEASDDHTPATVTPAGSGIWLGDPDAGEWLYVRGTGIDWQHEEDAVTFTPIGGSRTVRVVTGLRGLEGSVEGPMRAGQGLTLDEMRAAWRSIKERPAGTFRLVAGDVNIPVVVGRLSRRPHADTRTGSPVDHVSFDFWQDGELPFEAEL